MVRLSPQLSNIVRIVPSQKSLVGLPCNVEYKAISAEAGTAHGLSPILAVLDVGRRVVGLPLCPRKEWRLRLDPLVKV